MIDRLAPSHNIFAFYKDSTTHRIVLRFGNLMESVDISPQSGNAIKLAMTRENTIESDEVYDDDPTAHIWWLNPNGYICLMTIEDQEQAHEAVWRMRLELFGPTGMSGTPRANCGSGNVMNRIAHKRNRNYRQGY